jgi:methylated-DNA-[protein]-cysteine S-methyltransferase
MNFFYYQTTLGKIGIGESRGKITHLVFETDAIPKDIELRETAILKEAAAQLQAYLAGELREFSLPLAPAGTPFMRKVWEALLAIPYGTTVSYKHIAEAVGMPKAARAVGMANGRNPIPICIPCHRVIGKNGKLVGYSSGLDLKEKLLAIEKERP